MLSALFLSAAVALPTAAATASARGIDSTIAKVEQMPWDSSVTRLAQNEGLNVVNVTWEDTGRYAGSAVGPNITDLTIGVRDSQGALHPMPVFRFDNFTDTTADLPADDFYLPMGNAWGAGQLRSLSLTEILQDTRRYLHDPRSWAGRERSLWNARDAEVLVSAQACFLPVPRAGEATFTPVVYNYQSSPDNPAVLTMIATREGTSIQIVDNDSGYMSEPLFFNADGQRAPFTAVRASDVASGRISSSTPSGGISAAGEDAANVVLLVQVPLKHRAAVYPVGDGLMDEMMEAEAAPASRSFGSDVENAVIGHGPAEGPFTEIEGLEIERDARFPVRVTVQFYKATSNGVVTAQDVRDVRKQIDRVYQDASFVGSLVVDGPQGRRTEWSTQEPGVTWARPPYGGLKAW